MSIQTFLSMIALIGLTFINQAAAETVRLTIYDDGLSCPAGCDAHVVFHPTINGTEFAHSPSTPAPPYEKCLVGQKCALCLESGTKQCLVAIYRGGGPTFKTFDFTPRFYQTACASVPEQPALAKKCDELKRAATTLKDRKNCIAEPETTGCKEIVDQASLSQKTDRAEYLNCKDIGENKYNLTKSPHMQRSLGCAYETNGTGGPNSKGTTWKRLLPGACRDGTFVGRDGLDCCSGITLADGPLALECSRFYPKIEH